MTSSRHAAMTDALRLTRAGNLADATALIQRTLSSGSTGPAAAAPRDGKVFGLLPDQPAAPPAQPGAAAGVFHQRSYRGSAGTIDYRLYIPADARPMIPLVVMLHGCTQSPDDFASGTAMNMLADEMGFLVAYPAQTRGANAQKCWNWFRPEDQQRGSGEPARIAAMTQQIIQDHACDPARVYVAGLSAGGAAAAIMGATYPDIYAAIGVHSGLACGSAHDMPSAFGAMRGAGRPSRANTVFVPVITFHGDRDTTVDERNSQTIVGAASALAGPLEMATETGASQGGRSYTRTVGTDGAGKPVIEQWTVHGAGHAWSGGHASGSYTDPAGPDASREMIRFFLQQGG